MIMYTVLHFIHFIRKRQLRVFFTPQYGKLVLVESDSMIVWQGTEHLKMTCILQASCSPAIRPSRALHL